MAMIPRQTGFTLVELMVSMTLGLIITGAMLTVFINARDAQRTAESQSKMLDDARYAMHVLSQDLRMAGSWGRNSIAALVRGRHGDANALPVLSSDCHAGWYIDLDRKIFASQNQNPYGCIPGPNAEYQTDTDVLVVRYAQSEEIADSDLADDMVYVQSHPNNAELFIGAANRPNFSPDKNHVLQSFAYYISANTNAIGDGLPALRRVSLSRGPALQDELLISGVEDLQIQLGVDSNIADGDHRVEYYIDPNHAGFNWNDPSNVNSIKAIRIWLLIRSEREEHTATAQSFSFGSKTVNRNDGYRRLLVSSDISIRNRAIENSY